MASRGKKRRRADGTIAQGKLPPVRLGTASRREVEAVTITALGAAMTAGNRHVPIDRAAFDAAGGRDAWDDAAFDQLDAVDEIAAKHGFDVVDLNVRAGKLEEFLRDRPELYTIDAEGTVTIDPVLLDFAANSTMTDSNEPMIWPAI